MMKPSRPIGITILAVLDLLGGILFILGGLLFVAVGGSGLLSSVGYGNLSGVVSLLGGVALIAGIIAFLVGWGMWKGKGWGRMLALILYGLGAISSLVFIVLGSLTSVVGLLIFAFLLWYMFRPHVKAFFGKGTPQTMAMSPPSPPQTTT